MFKFFKKIFNSTTCPSCKKEISENVKVCPHCNAVISVWF